jgi:hypothetical protein
MPPRCLNGRQRFGEAVIEPGDLEVVEMEIARHGETAVAGADDREPRLSGHE